jgi:Zn-dependent M32 family carboxypeptidase
MTLEKALKRFNQNKHADKNIRLIRKRYENYTVLPREDGQTYVDVKGRIRFFYEYDYEATDWEIVFKKPDKKR